MKNYVLTKMLLFSNYCRLIILLSTYPSCYYLSHTADYRLRTVGYLDNIHQNNDHLYDNIVADLGDHHPRK